MATSIIKTDEIRRLNDTVLMSDGVMTANVDMSNITLAANHAGVKTALNASGDAPVYACRAWVNFDGTLGMTVNSSYGPDTSPNPIFASGNVTSITDLGVGIFAINFDVDMPHSNYAVAYSIEDGGGYNDIRVLNTDNSQSRTPSTYEFYAWDGTNLNDPEVMSLIFFA